MNVDVVGPDHLAVPVLEVLESHVLNVVHQVVVSGMDGQLKLKTQITKTLSEYSQVPNRRQGAEKVNTAQKSIDIWTMVTGTG